MCLGPGSRTFQADIINFSRIAPTLAAAKAALQSLVKTGEPVQKFKEAVKDLEKKDLVEFKVHERDVQQMNSLLGKYVNALLANIDHCFESTPILSSLALFDPMLMLSWPNMAMKK